MEAEDYSFHQGLEFLLNHDVNDLGYELTFSTEVPLFFHHPWQSRLKFYIEIL